MSAWRSSSTSDGIILLDANSEKEAATLIRKGLRRGRTIQRASSTSSSPTVTAMIAAA